MSHGYTATYDEVRRFRKSAAKYVSENALTLHQAMGFTKSARVVCLVGMTTLT